MSVELRYHVTFELLSWYVKFTTRELFCTYVCMAMQIVILDGQT